MRSQKSGIFSLRSGSQKWVFLQTFPDPEFRSLNFSFSEFVDIRYAHDLLLSGWIFFLPRSTSKKLKPKEATILWPPRSVGSTFFHHSRLRLVSSAALLRASFFSRCARSSSQILWSCVPRFCKTLAHDFSPRGRRLVSLRACARLRYRVSTNTAAVVVASCFLFFFELHTSARRRFL